jgi:hypothetical protein
MATASTSLQLSLRQQLFQEAEHRDIAQYSLDLRHSYVMLLRPLFGKLAKHVNISVDDHVPTNVAIGVVCYNPKTIK